MPTSFRSTTLGVIAAFIVSGAALAACNRSAKETAPAPAPSFLSDADAKAGWRSLASLSQWRLYQSEAAPTGWTSNDTIIGKNGVGTDIVSRKAYTDFEMAFDWMVDAGGNAGIFYRATEEYPKIYWSAPEYAVLDDAKHPDGRNVITSAGAAHSLYPAPRGVVKAANEWNTTRILVKGTHVEHWLNEQLIASFDYGTPDFTERVAKSKFARWPNFAKATSGVIGIQGDHGGKLQIRYLRIREFAK